MEYTVIVNRHRWQLDIIYNGIADEQVDHFIFKASKQKVSLVFFSVKSFLILSLSKLEVPGFNEDLGRVPKQNLFLIHYFWAYA